MHLTLYGPNFFIDVREKPKIACYRLPTHRRCAHNKIFFNDPFLIINRNFRLTSLEESAGP